MHIYEYSSWSAQGGESIAAAVQTGNEASDAMKSFP